MDNTELAPGGGGDKIRTKERGVYKTQVMGLDLTPGGGAETLMNGTMPVSAASLPSHDVTNAGTFAVQVSTAVAVSSVGGTVTTSAAQSGAWSVRNQDGAGNPLTSAARGSERALSVQVVDASGNQVASFGGGTQYAEGATAATITGTAMLWEDTADTLRSVSAAKPLPVNVVAGAAAGGTSAADQSTWTASTTPGTPCMGAFDDTGPSTMTEDRIGVLRMTGSRALHVNLRNASGTELSVGGGTQYTEDAVAAADPTGTSPMLVRKDTPSATVTTDGDNVAQRGSNFGAAYVTLLDSAGAFVSVGGGTQYAEDTVSVDAQMLTMAGVVRRDTPSSPTSASGDRTELAVDANGCLWAVINGTVTVGSHAVTNAGTFAAQETQVVTDNAAFTDGTSKLFMAGFVFDETAGTALTENDAAAPRVNANRASVSAIEDGATRARYATVTAANALKVDGSAVSQPAVGPAAHDAAVTGSPLLSGAEANRARITAVSAEGDTVRLQADRYGRLKVTGGTDCTVAPLQATASGDTTLVAAPGAGSRVKVLRVEASNSHATTALTVGLKNTGTAGGAAFGKKYLPAAGGQAVWQFPLGQLTLGDNETLVFVLSAAGTVEVTAYYEVVAT